jgi:hypothetical protein
VVLFAIGIKKGSKLDYALKIVNMGIMVCLIVIFSISLIYEFPAIKNCETYCQEHIKKYYIDQININKSWNYTINSIINSSNLTIKNE